MSHLVQLNVVGKYVERIYELHTRHSHGQTERSTNAANVRGTVNREKFEIISARIEYRYTKRWLFVPPVHYENTPPAIIVCITFY